MNDRFFTKKRDSVKAKNKRRRVRFEERRKERERK